MIQIVEPNEAVVVLCFEVALVGIRGYMAFCLPVDAFKRLTVCPISPAVIDTFEDCAKTYKTYDYGE